MTKKRAVWLRRMMAYTASCAVLPWNGPLPAGAVTTTPVTPPAPPTPHTQHMGLVNTSTGSGVIHHHNASQSTSGGTGGTGNTSGTSTSAQNSRIVDPVTGRPVNGAQVVSTIKSSSQTSQSQTTQISASGKAVPISQGVALNLASSAKTIQVGSDALGGQSSVLISVGGKALTVQAGSLLTAAEFVALQQQVAGGGSASALQLNLNSKGEAAGGSLSISTLQAALANDPLTGLTIPQGVTALDNLGTGALKVGGSVVDQGSLYAYSTNNSVTAGSINAQNINVGAGGSLSSVLPASVVAEVGKTETGFGLNLAAVNAIQNSGSITSGGSLSLSANSIANTSTASSPAVIQANNNLSLSAPSVQNSGTLQSLHGDVNFTAPGTSTLNVNGNGGTVLAQSGNINVSTNGNSNVTGGNYYSQQFNVNAGPGTANVSVGQLTGQVNVTAENAHIIASTPNLNFGTMDVQGDPTYGNLTGAFSSAGISASNGQSITIAAAGDVDITGGALSTSSATGGGALNIIAGANLTGGPINTNPITVNGASTTGGIINLTGVTGITTATTGTGAGGNLTMIANAGTEAGSGSIIIPAGAPITTAGAAGSANGNVLMIAGATSGTGITSSSITTGPGTAGTGTVTLRTSTPTVTAGGVVISAAGSITSGSFGAGATQASAIQASAISTTGNGVEIASGSNVSLNGSITTDGGSLAVLASGNVTTGAAGLSLSTGSATNTTAAQNLTVVAGANLQPDPVASSPTQIYVAGKSATGGSIDFNTNALSTLNTSNTAAGAGPNGNVNLVAFDGSQAGSGTVTLPAAVTVTTGGGATNTANGGSVTIIGGNQTSSAKAVTVGAINTTSNTATAGTSPAGSVTVAAAAPEVSNYVTYPWLSINTGNVTTGSLVAGDARASAVQAGNITANSAAVSVTAGGNVTVGQVTDPGSTVASSINLASGGTLAAGSTISTSSTATGVGGGTITVKAQTLPATAVSIQANGPTGSGAGGNITVTQSGTGNVTIGTGALTLSAMGGTTGGNGGDITVSAGGNLTAAAASIINNVAVGASSSMGGEVYLTAGAAGPGNLSVTGGGFNVNGVSTGSNSGAGGTIILVSNSATAFTVGSATANGVNGTLSAQPGAGGGYGGTISIVNNGTGGITIGATNDITVDNTNATGAQHGGIITLSAPLGPITFSSVAGGGVMSVSASGTGGTETTQSGGSINITGNSITVDGTPTAPTLNLTANGAGPGDGGKITITSLGYGSTNNITIGQSQNDITISATGGSAASATGNGGILTVSSGNNLTFDGGAVNLSATGTNGTGGTVNLTVLSQGNGTLNFLNINPLDLNGVGTGNGGSLNMTAYTTAALSLGGVINLAGGTGANTTGGTLTVVNYGTGGVTLLPPSGGGGLAITATGTALTPTGTVSISSALGPISVTSGATADAISAGTINLKAFSLGITGGALSLVSNAPGTTLSNGGTITVVTTGAASDITVGGAAGDIEISANGGTTSGNGGTITLTAARNLTINGANLTTTPVLGNGGIYDFTAGTAGYATLSIVNNALTDNGAGTGSGGTIDLVAPAFNIGTTNLLALTANGGASGAGGKIIVDATSPYSSLNVGTVAANSDLSLTAQGGATAGNGGLVQVIAGGSLTVDPAGISVNGASANGSGGVIILQGAQGGAGNVSVINTLLNVSGAGTGAGGTVIITAGNASTTSAQSSITINGTITATGSGAAAFTGSTYGNSQVIISDFTKGTVTLPGNIVVDESNGQGGYVAINPTAVYNDVYTEGVNAPFMVPSITSPVTTGATSFSANATLTSGASAVYNAGQITVNGSTVTLTAAQPLALTASALTSLTGIANTGTGGTININAGSLSVGNAAGSFTITAVGGGTGYNSTTYPFGPFANGAVNLTASSGNLTIDTQYLTVGPNTNTGSGVTNANGGSITLSASNVMTVTSSGAHVLSTAGLGSGFGGNITIDGNYSSTGSVNIGTNIVADAGATATGAYLYYGYTYYTNAGGNIDIYPESAPLSLPALVSSNSAVGAGGSIDIAGGSSAVTIAGGSTIEALNNSNQSASSSLDLYTSTLNITGTGAVTLNTSNTAVTSTSGGIGVQTTSSQGDLNIGVGNGDLKLIAQTGVAGDNTTETSGSIDVEAGRNLTVNPAGLVITPLGNVYNIESVFLEAGTAAPNQGNLLITGNLVANSKGASTYPYEVELISNSSNPFVIGGSGQLNGVQGNIQANGNYDYPYGYVYVTNNGSGGITISNPQTSIEVAGNADSAGNISITSSNGPVNFITSTTTTLSSSNTSYYGGTISITGSTINVLASGGGPGPALTLNANGANGGGQGGTITVNTTAPTGDLTIGNAAGNLTLTATGGSVSDVDSYDYGGTISVTAGRNLTVNPAFLTASPLGTGANDNYGEGAHYTLIAGASTGNDNAGVGGNLLITGSLSANGVYYGGGGSIELTSNSATPFTTNNGAATNGLYGTLSASAGGSGSSYYYGGTIDITSLGSGGITITHPSDVAVAGVAASAGTINILAANAPLTIVNPATPFVVTNGAASYFNPTIALTGSSLVITGTNQSLTIDANSTASGAFGGSVNVTTTGAGSNLYVGTNTGNNSYLVINAEPGLAADTSFEYKATVILSAGGNLTVNPASLNVQPLGTYGGGASLTFTAGTGGSGNVSLAGLSVNGVGLGGAGSINISAPNGAIDVTGTGQSLTANGTVAGAAPGAISLSASQGVVFSAPPTTIAATGTASGGSIIIAGGSGAVNFGSTTAGNILVTAAGGSGTVAISGNGILLNAGSNLQVVADAPAGTAGKITIINIAEDSGISSAGDLTIGTGGGQISLSALGAGTGSAATPNIEVATGGNLTVNTSGLAYGAQTGSGAGASLSFLAGAGGSGGLTVNGNLNVSGSLNGAGGAIVLSSYGNANMAINGSLTADGGPGGTAAYNSLAAGTIYVSNYGSGGITLANNVTADSTLSSGGTVVIDAYSGALTFTGSSIVSASSSGSVGSFNFAYSNPGTGGIVNVIGSTITGSATSAIEVLANGVSGGLGGTISVQTIAKGASLTVGAANGDLILSATGSGAGTNGSVTVWSGGDLTVTTSSLAVGAVGNIAGSGSAGSISLEAGGQGSHQGNLTIVGALNVDNNSSANNTSAGSINLVMNSTLPFAVGGTGTNSVSGGLSAQNFNASNAGSSSISVVNNGGGGITVANPTSINLTSLGTGGSLTLSTAGALTIGSGSLSTGGAGGSGGSITLAGSTITVTGGALALSINGGSATINSLSTTSTLTIGSGTGDISISDVSGVLGVGGISPASSGTVSVTSFGTLNVNTAALTLTQQQANQNGASMTLVGGSNGVGGLTINGAINVNGVGLGNGGIVSITDGSDTALALTGNISANSGLAAATTNYTGYGGGVTVDIQGTGGLSSASPVNITANGTLGGGSVNLDLIIDFVASPLTLAGGSNIQASALAGNSGGGSVSVKTSTLTETGAGAINFAANGAGGGSGGVISLDQNTGNFNFGTASGDNLTAQATGGSAGSDSGNGGTINLTTQIGSTNIAQGAATFAFGPLGLNGNGGNVSLTTANSSSLLITTGFSLNGVGVGNGGTFSAKIATSNAAPFTIGGSGAIAGIDGTLSSNGGATGGAGGSLTVTNSGLGGIIIVTGTSLAVSGTNAKSGTIVLDADASGQGALTFANTGTLALNGASGYNGATLTIDAVTVNTQTGGFTISSNGTGSGNGGSITLVTGSSPVTGPPLVLTANGGATGNGGSVTVKASSAAVVVGNGTNGIELQAEGGSTFGNGGTIEVQAGLGLTVNAAQVAVNAGGTSGVGNGGSILLYSGLLDASPLAITGSLSANGGTTSGNGGEVYINSTSSTAFTLGTASANGISGTISANAGTNSGNGGTVTVSAQAGLTVSALSGITVAAPAGNGGSVSLLTSGALTFNDATPSLSVNAGTGNFNGGAIVLRGDVIATPNDTTAPFSLSANGSGTGNGGSITITSSDVVTGTVNLATTTPVAGQLTATVSANSGAAAGNAGSITVQAANITVATGGISLSTGTGNGSGGAISLTGGHGAGSLIDNANLSVNGSGTGNGGTIYLIDSGSNQLQVNGNLTANGGALGGSGGGIQITNSGTGGILINAQTLSANAAVGSGGSVGITGAALGTSLLTIGSAGQTTTISANAGTSGDGGTVNITSAQLSLTSGIAGGLVLQANGNATGGGSGGEVFVNIANNGSTAVIVDSTSKNGFSVSVLGSNSYSSGSVTIEAGGDLTVNTGSITTNTVGHGASITLAAGQAESGQFVGQYPVNGNLVINGPALGVGSLNASADQVTNSGANTYAISDGGSITLISNSSSPFTIGATGPYTNGINGSLIASGIDGGSITVKNYGLGGISVLSGATINVNAFNGQGGSIILDAAPNTGSTTAALGQGPLSIALGSLSANGAASAGGSIYLRGTTITVTGGPLVLSANGGTGGNGGSVSVIASSSASNLTIGNATGNIEISAIGQGGGTYGYGSGGTINVSSGGNLTVNTAYLNATAGFADPNYAYAFGSQVSLVAGSDGSGNLKITGALNVDTFGDGYYAGTLVLSSNSSSPFVVDNVTNTNGINLGGGLLAATSIILGGEQGPAGSISITNSGTGGITVNVPASIQLNGGDGSLSLTAPNGPITINAGTGAALSVNGGAGSANGGDITIAGALTVGGTGPLTLSANGAAGGNGGNITVTTTSGLAIGNAAGAIELTAQASSTTSSPSLGGTIKVSAGGNLTVDANYVQVVDALAIPSTSIGLNATGGNIYLTAGTAGTGDLAISNNLSANGTGYGSGGTISLQWNDPTNDFVIGAGGTMNGATGVLSANSGLAGSTQTVSNTTNAGMIFLLNNATSGTGGINIATPGNISLQASGGSGGILLIDSLNGGNVTLGAGALSVNGFAGYGNGTIPGGAAGVVEIGVAANGSAVPVNLIVNGNFTISANSYGSSTATYLIKGLPASLSSGTININSSQTTITGGVLTLTANGSNAAGLEGARGGFITVQANNNLTVGNANGDISISAQGGDQGSLFGGDGGSATVISGTNLTVNPTFLVLNPLGVNGTGAQIDLVAGAVNYGNLAVTGSINANGVGYGTGGSISLVSDSPTPFDLGAGIPTPLNGLFGSISANSGSVTASNGSFLYTQGGGTIYVNNLGTGGVTVLSAPTAISSGGPGGTIELNISPTGLNPSDGPLIISAGTINANGAGLYDGAGGTIGLGGSVINVVNGALQLNANGAPEFKGGTVNIATWANVGNVTIGSASGNIGISAGASDPGNQGLNGAAQANGGTADIEVGGILTVNPANLLVSPATNGRGGSYTLDGATVVVNGPLSANGVGFGGGGSISISTNSATPFVVGTSSANGVNGALTANSGPTVLPQLSGSNGGSIYLDNVGGNLTINATTLLSATSVEGNGGSIYLYSGYLIDRGYIAISPGTVTITTGSTLATSSINVNSGSSSTANGGHIVIAASALTISGGTQPLTLSANGGASGQAGAVSVITSAATSNLSVGPGAGALSLSATGGASTSESGGEPTGYVEVAAGGNLTVNPSGITVGPPAGAANANGGNITLRSGISGAGNLVVGGGLSANGVGTGNGGSVALISNSGTTFTIGSSTANSINGAVSASSGASGGNAGFVLVTNLGTGGVTLNAIADIGLATVGGGGGTIVLNGTSGVNIAGNTSQLGLHTGAGPLVLPSGTLSVNGGPSFPMLSSSGQAGSIYLNGTTITVPTGNLILSASGAASGISAPGLVGDISVTATTGAINVASTGANTIQLQLNGIIGSASNSSSAPNINLSAGSNLTIAGSAISTNSGGFTSYGPNITLQAGTNGSGTLQVTGNINASATGSGNGGTVYIQYNDATNPFTIGGVTANSFISGNLTADSPSGIPGSITFTNSNLLATSGVNVTVLATGTLSALGPAVSSQQTSASIISLNGTSYQSASLTSAGTLNGIISATGAGITITAAATATNPLLALGNLSADAGNILVTNNGNTGTNSGIQVVPGANLQASNNSPLAGTGSITLQSNDTTTGFITVGYGSNLAANGTVANPGTVTLTIGAAQQVAGTQPPDTNVTVAGGSTVDFGTNGISTLPISNSITTFAANANVTFSNSTAPASAISLLGDVNIQTTSGAVAPTITLGSLDLSNALVLGQLESLQAVNLVGGNLSTAKTLTLNGQDVALGTTSYPMTAFNIPTGYSVTLQNFNGSANVTLNYNSTTLNVPIAGALTFTTSNNPVININSNNLPQLSPAVNISGTITANNGLTINTAQDNSYPNYLMPVTNSGSITVATGNFNINAYGTVTNTSTGTITATTGGISLVATSGSNGSIVMNGNLSAPGAGGSVSVYADDNGVVTYAPTTLVTHTLNLSSVYTDLGTVTSPITIPSTVSTVTASTDGNAFITAAQTMTIGPSLVGSELSAWTTAGNLNTSGDVNGTTTVLQTFGSTSGTGNILVNGDVGSIAGVTTLYIRNSATGTITDSSPTGIDALHGNPVALVAGTSGSIGTAAAALRVQTPSLYTSTNAGPGLVNVLDSNTYGANLYGNNTGTGNYTLTSESGILITATTLTTSSKLTLATQNNGNIEINEPIGSTSTVVAINPNGSGEVYGNNSPVIASSLTFNAGTGPIFLNISTPTVQATSSGVVALGNLPTSGTLDVLNTTASQFSVGASNSVLFNNVTSTGPYFNASVAGTLTVAPGANIQVTNGFIQLDDVNATAPSINIGTGATLSTIGAVGNFPVYIVVGTIPTNPVVGTKPANVVIGTNTGGTAYYGTNSINVPTAPVTLNLAGSNIVFSTGTFAATAITVGKNVTITADPLVQTSGLNPSFAGLLQVPVANVTAGTTAAGAVPAAATAGQAAASSSALLPAREGISLNPTLLGTTDVAQQSNAVNVSTAAGNVQVQMPSINSINVSHADLTPSAQTLTGSGADLSTSSANVSLSGSGSSGLNLPTLPATIGVPSGFILNSEPFGGNVNSGLQSIMNSTNTMNVFDAESITERALDTRAGIVDVLESDKFDVDIAECENFGLQAGAISSDMSYRDEDEDLTSSTEVDKSTGRVTLVTGLQQSKRVERRAVVKKGNVLFAPFKDTVVDTPNGSVHISANSVVLVAVNGSTVSVYDLDDRHNRSVRVMVGKDCIPLAPGQHVTLTGAKVDSFEQANAAQFVGYKAVRERILSSGTKAFTSDFAIMSVVTNVKAMRRLATSKHPEARKLATHLLKTNAVLLVMQRSNEPYQLMLRPRLTAMR